MVLQLDLAALASGVRRRAWSVRRRLGLANARAGRCSDCGAMLTSDEVEYYGACCDACEGAAYHAMEGADRE